ncbi:hypothetical protein [Streptomyces cellulosae]|uniref:hypothetical protein n=1 Tax=Streptomyces cellulosae TaxID=1968 RepID=UPI0004C83D7D|nr:hypothetical protein [Streptomyces cellulosae]
MASGPPFSLGVETHEGLAALTRAIRAEEDGKALRKELAANMREALKPAAAEAKSSIMAMASAGLPTAPALRASVAKKIRPEVKLGGRWSGARVKAFKTKNIRNFPNAPKRLNRAGGWRHPVYGNREVWAQQRGKPEWFDRSFEGRESHYKEAVEAAMENMARRIASRAG